MFLVIWIVFVKQAREWAYVIDEDKVLMPFFAGIWGRVVTIFDLDVLDEDGENTEEYEVE